jgi:quercetin dioxygenase-like cupin family protein
MISRMRILRLGGAVASPITEFDSASATSVGIADGEGEAHIYLIAFEPGGLIGPHEAGFGQLFVPAQGIGWVAGEDGRRIALGPGDAAFIRRGEIHSKGSEQGMTALMVQVRDLIPRDSVLHT